MDRGPKGIKVSFLKQHEGGGQEALHVGCSTSSQPPAHLCEGVGVGRPAGSGGNHVGVTRQQNPARRVRTEAEVQVGPTRLARNHGDGAADSGGPLGVQVDQIEVRRPALSREGHQVGQTHLARHHVKHGTGPMGSIRVVVDQVDIGRATFRGVRD